METNQSFNAEFNLDSQTVLLNLRHLLMCLRWNKNQPINYQEWLITVVNDCFFYFLKQSEPVYAFHALRMAEAYCKNAIYVTQDATPTTAIPPKSRNRQVDLGLLRKLFEPIHDIYNYHNPEEYMKKSTVEKLKVSFDFF